MAFLEEGEDKFGARVTGSNPTEMGGVSDGGGGGGIVGDLSGVRK